MGLVISAGFDQELCNKMVKTFNMMFDRYMDRLDGESQEALNESISTHHLDVINKEYSSIRGVVSYLYTSGIIDYDEYSRLEGQVWDIYISALRCIDEKYF